MDIAMLRRALRPLWILLALLFLAEAWLWEHLEPVVARVVAYLPLRALKVRLSAAIERLPPLLTLPIFLIPFVLLFPLKLLAVALLVRQQWAAAIGVFIIAQLLGVGVAAFIFDVTRPKLMQMRWFARAYDVVIGVRSWARTMVAPVRVWLAELRAQLFGADSPRWLRRASRTRRRMLAVR